MGKSLSDRQRDDLLSGDTITPVPSASATGALLNRFLAAATTNLRTVKNAPGRILGWRFVNTSAAVKFVKIYDKASNPVLASDVPVITIPLPANGATDFNLGGLGVTFANGIAMACTGAVADNDATAVAANDVVGFIAYI
jgi:hypothetical protein